MDQPPFRLRVSYIVLAVVLVSVGWRVFDYRQKYHLTEELRAAARAKHGWVHLNGYEGYHGPQWLLDRAKQHGCERYIEWLKSDIMSIDVHDPSIDDAWLRRLKRYRNIQVLTLKDTRITGAGLSSLASLPALWGVTVNHTRITDADLPSLKSLRGLTWLELNECQITDAGMPILVSLPNLKVLYLDGTRITDEGLAALKPLTHLETLHIDKTHATEAGCKMLYDALPSLKEIRFDGKKMNRPI